jgi:glycosidase
MSKTICILILATVFFSACGPAATPVPATPEATSTVPTAAATAAPVQPIARKPEGTDGYPWWNDTVFYQIFVRSFYDSDGDGIGDFNGIIEKLDYLNDGDPATTTDLGVTGLWLMPIHPSPTYHGYDVLDYYAVNPQYGTLDDFKRLLSEAHQRGIRVLIDWVPNHSSREHPWFRAALKGDPNFRDWYVWSPAEPTPSSGWHRSVNGDYYYGHFWEGMPDLNYKNPAVGEEMKQVAEFWLKEVGVDGFRIDAIKYLVEEGSVIENADATHRWLEEFRPFYQSLNPQALMVGEIWDGSVNVSNYTEGDELDLGFNFDLARAWVLGAARGRAQQSQQILARDINLFRPLQFAVYLTNHDQDRLMSVLGDDLAKAKVAAALLLTAPGVPFIYYGEEIGMLGKKPDEDIRLPMQWSAEANAGFSAASGIWRPANPDYPMKNVAAQSSNPDSLLSTYRSLIHLRNNHAALRAGETLVLETGNPAVYALLRVGEQQTALVVINLGADPVSDYALTLKTGPLPAASTMSVAPIWGASPAVGPTITAEGGLDAYQPLPELAPQSVMIVQLK